MLYITGDTHGEITRFMYADSVIERTLTASDKLIIAGDFGYLFEGNFRERQSLDFLAQKSYMILFVDGNHENFELLNGYPIEEWCGGKVHVIRRDKENHPKIIHLIRGQVFMLEGKRVFTFGGAYSVDQFMRTPYRTWWPQELPSDEEMKEAIANLKKVDNCVDYIVTHTGPEYVMYRLYGGTEAKEKPLANFLEWVRENVQFDHWFMGHHHKEFDVTPDITILWFQLRNMITNEIIEE